MEQPAGYRLALGAMAHHVTSALPNAPVRPDPPRRSPVLRRTVAAGLRRLADRMEPTPAPAPSPCV